MGLSAVTNDSFLDGRVQVRQLVRGFRSGLDAVMLAAAVPAKRGDRILELGAGAGVASLCLAARMQDCDVIGVELSAELTALANENAAINAMAARVRFVAADALSLPRPLRIAFDRVICNPPFHDRDGHGSPDGLRAKALQDTGSLSRWIATGVKRTAPGGTFTMILRADRLREALDHLPAMGIAVFPLWPKAGEPAKRVLIQFSPGRRTPFTLLAGLVLHQDDGRYTPQAEAILRGRAALEIAESRR
jgi:tRNA1Val (adenine37-N6)-methyltransferase